MSWYKDSATLSAIGSIGAVVIAVIALYFSHRGQSQQRLREQREELRGVLERLVSFREEQNALSKESDVAFKAGASAWQNTKRAIYLEAAETLARQMSRHLTASELFVVGLENHWDADVHDARSWYNLALQHFRDTSPPRQAEILRFLASTYYVEDPTLRDLSKGRATYLRAVQALEDREDVYSHYAQALTNRAWGVSEISVKNFEEASERLGRARDEWSKIPANQGIAWTMDLRNLAYAWGQLGWVYFQNRQGDVDTEKGRAAFGVALDLAKMLSSTYGDNSDYTRETSGLLYLWWGQKEHEIHNHDRGEELFGQAEKNYLSLAEHFLRRSYRLAELKGIQSTFAEGGDALATGEPATGTHPGPDPHLKGVGVTPETSIASPSTSG